MTSGTLSGIMTVLALLAFLSVVFWAFNPKRKKDFDSAASLPLNDDPPSPALNTDNKLEPNVTQLQSHDKEVK